jgi:hypothetical protein
VASACVHGCVCTYAFMEVGVPHVDVDVECVRACVYAQIKGMVVFIIIIIGFYGVGRVGRRGRGRT